MSDFLIDLRANGGEPSLREVIKLCVDEMPEEALDAPIGRDRSSIEQNQNETNTYGKSVLMGHNLGVDIDGVTGDHSSLEHRRNLYRKEYRDRVAAL